MKKIAVLLLALIMTLSLCSCSFINLDLFSNEDQPEWTTRYTVDELGELTDEAIIMSTVKGTFSNLTITDEELTVDVGCLESPYQGMVFSFKLLEYGENRAAFYDYQDIVLTTKIGEVTDEYELAVLDDGTLYTTGYWGVDIFNALLYNDIDCTIKTDMAEYTFTLDSTGFYDEAMADEEE